jgi:hypothetical protein
MRQLALPRSLGCRAVSPGFGIGNSPRDQKIRRFGSVPAGKMTIASQSKTSGAQYSTKAEPL